LQEAQATKQSARAWLRTVSELLGDVARMERSAIRESSTAAQLSRISLRSIRATLLRSQ
jgi:hypothetical protein